MDAAGTRGALAVEEWVLHGDARLAKIDAHPGRFKCVALPQVGGDVVEGVVGRPQTGVGGRAQHAVGRVVVGHQLRFPVGQVGPLVGLEEGLGRDAVRAGVDQRPTADTGAVEQPDILEEVQALRPKAAQGGHPQIFEDIPVGLGEIIGVPALAALDDQHGVTLLGQPPGGHGTAKAGADDDVIINRVNVRRPAAGGLASPIHPMTAAIIALPIQCDLHVPVPFVAPATIAQTFSPRYRHYNTLRHKLSARKIVGRACLPAASGPFPEPAIVEHRACSAAGIDRLVRNRVGRRIGPSPPPSVANKRIFESRIWGSARLSCYADQRRRVTRLPFQV